MRFSLHSPGRGNIGVKLDCEILVNLSGLFCLKTRKQTPIPALKLLRTLARTHLFPCTLELPIQPAGQSLGGRCPRTDDRAASRTQLINRSAISWLREMEAQLPLSTMDPFHIFVNKAYPLGLIFYWEKPTGNPQTCALPLEFSPFQGLTAPFRNLGSHLCLLL